VVIAVSVLTFGASVEKSGDFEYAVLEDETAEIT